MKILAKVEEGYVLLDGTRIKCNKYPDIGLAVARKVIERLGKYATSGTTWTVYCLITGFSTVFSDTKQGAIDSLNTKIGNEISKGDFPKLVNSILKECGKADKSNIVSDLTKSAKESNK